MTVGRRILSGKDYLALGLSLMLAFAVWLVHNLSLDYSALVQRAVVAKCEIDAHSNVSTGSSEVAASCEISGFDLLAIRMAGRKRPVKLEISKEDMHHYDGDVFFMTKDDATKYFHLIFSDKARLEYFVTDTVFFTFNSVEYKKVPVRLTSNISYKPQYMAVGGIKLEPDSVLIYGNKEIIDAVNYVASDVVRLHNLDCEIYGKTRLKPIKNVRMSVEQAGYSISVVRYVQREVTLPVRTENVPKGTVMKVFPNSATLHYRMKFPSDASMEDVKVSIDYVDFYNSISGKCVPQIEGLPPEVLQYELDPEVFECLVEGAE